MSEVWWIFNKSSLAQCKYILSSSFRPCCKWVKVWVAWLSSGIQKYCLESSFISSLYIKFDDSSLNLLAEVKGDPIIFIFLFTRCLNQTFELHFLLMLSRLQIWFYHHRRFLPKILLHEWWLCLPLLLFADWHHWLYILLAWDVMFPDHLRIC